MNAPTIFSRILLVLSALLVVVSSYWFIATSLAPIPVPEALPGRGTVHFDPAADITKKPRFSEMRLLGPAEVPSQQLGRPNPFAPIPGVPEASTTTPVSTSGTQP